MKALIFWKFFCVWSEISLFGLTRFQEYKSSVFLATWHPPPNRYELNRAHTSFKREIVMSYHRTPPPCNNISLSGAYYFEWRIYSLQDKYRERQINKKLVPKILFQVKREAFESIFESKAAHKWSIFEVIFSWYRYFWLIFVITRICKLTWQEIGRRGENIGNDNWWKDIPEVCFSSTAPPIFSLFVAGVCACTNISFESNRKLIYRL